MTDLIAQARLTEEEQRRATFDHPVTEAACWQGGVASRIADAQLQKALWTVYDWSDGFWLNADDLRRVLKRLLEQADIERPKAAPVVEAKE